jgi:hypothetical protein
VTDELLKSDIASWLHGQGFEVTTLDRQEQKTPDLLAKKDCDEYLIEIKAKQDDAQQVKEEAARLNAGEVVTIASRWGPKNVVDGIVKDGVDQLTSFGDPSMMRILWLHAVGRDPESQAEQFFHTLYGATNVIDLFDRHLNRQCYYFYNSSFYRFRSKLDGAVLSRITGQTKFILNSLSPQHERLSRSCLARAFGSAVVDPARGPATSKLADRWRFLFDATRAALIGESRAGDPESPCPPTGRPPSQTCERGKTHL